MICEIPCGKLCLSWGVGVGGCGMGDGVNLVRTLSRWFRLSSNKGQILLLVIYGISTSPQPSVRQI